MFDPSHLTLAQRDIVLAPDGPVLVLAGPGSGKTTLIAARIAHLIDARQIQPASILAMAFTRTAARQLRLRLAGILRQQAKEVDVTTSHALGLRIIRQWTTELGFARETVSVYSADETREVIRTIVEALGCDLGRQSLADVSRQVQHFRLTGEIDDDEIRQVAQEYEATLRRRSVVDYTAMLALPLRLFHTSPEALRLHQDAYRYVFADEFQDLTDAQYDLLRQLAERHRNLLVVGDPAQNLFAWRGADLHLLQRLQNDFSETRLFHLDQSFRSTHRIVDMANAVGQPLSLRQALWTDNPRGQAPVLFVADDESAEAAFVAGEISRLLARGAIGHPGEAAVLYRTNKQVHELTLALRVRRLPYLVRGGGDLFARREVRDAIAYLRVVENPADTVALARIVNVPARGLGRLVPLLPGEPVQAFDLPKLAEPYGDAAVSQAQALAGVFAMAHVQRDGLTPAQLLDLVLQESGYRGWLAGRADGAERLSALSTLRSVLEAADQDLGCWLAELQAGEDMDHQVGDLERVICSTIHRAKGDEWRVAFLIGLEEGLLPHHRALTDAPYDPSVLQDELRLAYVAVTRARERLYVTYCRERHRGDRVERTQPSRFLRSLPAGLLARAA